MGGIIYPKPLIKKPVRINAYGEKAWGEVNYWQAINGGYREYGNAEFVRGYRLAIADIKSLNKGEK